MKQLLTILLIGFTTAAVSQEKINYLSPPPSPEASFTQQLGTGEVKVNYSRPLARGRKILGGLVPFDSLWRTGASGASTIEFTEGTGAGDVYGEDERVVCAEGWGEHARFREGAEDQIHAFIGALV